MRRIRSPCARAATGHAAGREADDDAHRPRWIGLCLRDTRYRRERGSARGQMQDLPTVGKFHFEPPSRFTSFDHLVGGDEHSIWYLKAKRLRGLEVDSGGGIDRRNILKGYCAIEARERANK